MITILTNWSSLNLKNHLLTIVYVNSFLDVDSIQFYIYTNTHILFWTKLPEMPITICRKLDIQHK